jgi:transcription-repair coupling factor (superfamily II helicase)
MTKGALDAGALIARPGRLALSGVPEGYDAIVLGRIATAARGRPVLYIARDDSRLARLADTLRFFAPEIVFDSFPAWDCLPYDRVSPRADLLSQRAALLARLAHGWGRGQAAAPTVLLSTVNAVSQRVPPRSRMGGAALVLESGKLLDRDRLIAFLEANGFVRTGTVMEGGEYALRGSIIDLYPPSAEQPVRLDQFGDQLESIRGFDPLTQRSAGTLERVELTPVSELPLTPEAVSRFQGGYRTLFGAVTSEDPLFEAISAQRHYPGMEHWLPLFYERLETLFDYLGDGPVVLDHLAERAHEERLTAVADFYDARASAPRASLEANYKPVPVAHLFLDQAEWEAAARRRPWLLFGGYGGAESGAQMRDLGGRPGQVFASERASAAPEALFAALAAHCEAERARGLKVILAAWSGGGRERLRRLVVEHGAGAVAPVESIREVVALPPTTMGLAVLPLDHGFRTPDLAVIAEADIFGERLSRPERKKRVRAENFLSQATELKEDDLVVHADHGIGRYVGLETIQVDGAPHDCLRLLYDGDDKLFLPVENIELLSRYGDADQPVALDKLGGAHWQARKARLKKRILAMAAELIKVAAERQLRSAVVVTPPDVGYEAFAARFPYVETEDQARAIDDTLADLAAGRPMDRLICGDVGFGKTEVALRAAFAVAASGHQVALLAPTTLLCRQHLAIFRARFEGFNLKIAQLSRLVSAKDAATIKRAIAAHEIDIVIGTHALLGEGIQFTDLGLVIVDEEQHFGVKHKERLKRLKADIHVLTLTATPIPRTLQLALSGVRDMSVIATPPIDRLAVRTFILPYDSVVVREAIMREHFRGGQTFYVCPHIADLQSAAERLHTLVPECKVIIAHGQLGPSQLEDVMAAFYEGAADILVSTAIVESGLDLPRVNTLIVHRADRFGLAQLYQLRGRIGRAKLRAYAYLTLPASDRLTEAALKRLDVIHRLDSLGAGFALASHDLDIRGAGNLLGPEQSGHVREVGLELYQQMLEEAVRAARAGPLEEQPPAQWSPHVGIGMAVLIPEAYVADLDVRLGLYRRIARLEDQAEIDGFLAELEDRFGPPPEEVRHLLEVVAIKRLCRQAGIARVEAGPKGAVFSFRDNSFAPLERLIAYVSRPENGLRLRPDSRLVAARAWQGAAERARGVRKILADLAALAA